MNAPAFSKGALFGRYMRKSLESMRTLSLAAWDHLLECGHNVVSREPLKARGRFCPQCLLDERELTRGPVKTREKERRMLERRRIELDAARRRFVKVNTE